VTTSSHLIRCLFVASLLLGAGLSFGQVSTGAPPFSSLGGGPFDTVDLGNLNVHFSIPILNKAGRGIPFAYALSYDSSIWSPVTGGGSTNWSPAANWGWRATTESLAGYVSETLHIDIQGCGGSWWTFTYHGPDGTPHDFPLYPRIDPYGNCGTPTGSGVTQDGSGYGIYIDASGTTQKATVFPPSGGSIYFPDLTSSQTGAVTITDPNGNYVQTTDGVHFTDTANPSGANELVITTGSNYTKYTYTAPSGASAVYQVNYSSYNILTKFNCTSPTIHDFGPLQESLVSSITLPDTSQYTFTYEQSDTTHYTGRIASVKLPTGSTISYTYTGSNNGIECADGSAAGLTRTTPDSTTAWTYTRSGSIPSTTTTVKSPPDPNTGNQNKTVISFYNNYETNRQVYTGTSSLQETVQTCYNNSCSTSPLAPITQLNVYRSVDGTSGTNSSQVQMTYDATSGLPTDTQQFGWVSSAWSKLSDETTSYTSFTNPFDPSSTILFYRPNQIVAYDGSSNMKAKTAYAYDQNTLQSPSGSTNHTSVTGSRGNLTTLTKYVTSSTTLVQQFWYNDTGTLYQSQDVNQATTTFNYGSCGNSYLSSVTLPVGSMSRSMAWNCTGGVLKSLTDENSKTSYINYTTDQYFWRPESTKDQLGNITNLTYTGSTQVESSMNFNGTTSTVDVLTTLDGLGRPYLTQRKQGQASSTYDSVEQQYDALGRPYQRSVAYAAAAGGSAPSGTPENITYYDGVDRTIETINGYVNSTSSGPTVSLSYPNLNDAYQSLGPAPTGENTKDRQLEYDAAGRLASVCEVTSTLSGHGTCAQISSSTGYWTKYTYDSPLNSMKVTQSAQGGTAQSRTYQYDMLGRLTSEANPESGTTTYVYDSIASGFCAGTYNGDLIERVDSASNYTCYSYDALHRVTLITYPSGPSHTATPTRNFVYDSATVNGHTMSNAQGRLAEAYTGSSGSKATDRAYSYSARGEVTDIYSSTTNSNGYYHITKSYWPNGALASVGGIPGVPTLYYGASNGSGLDGEGRITKVSASSGQNPVTGVTYSNSAAPIGAITQVTYGSGDFDQFTADSKTGLMTGFGFNIGTGGLALVGTLTWNQNGTLQTLNLVDPFATSPAVTNQTCTYNYDDLGRVGGPSGSGGVKCVDGSSTTWQQTFSPDVFGNITKSGSISWQCSTCYDQTTNHYNTTNGNFTYNNMGDLTYDTFHQYEWDSEGHPWNIDSGASTQTYDALGNMVEITAGSWQAQYLYDENGYEYGPSHAGGSAFAMIPLPGGGRALYSGGTLENYGHSDWLGSYLLTSSASQTYVGGSYRAPYGEPFTVSNGTDVLQYFAGIGNNIETDLWDAKYREYHATQGRWISPDPAGLAAVDMTNPQTWNRYAYVMNNPLSGADPSGLYCPVWFRGDHLPACSQGTAGYNWGWGSFPGSWVQPIPGAQNVASYDYKYVEGSSSIVETPSIIGPDGAPIFGTSNDPVYTMGDTMGGWQQAGANLGPGPLGYVFTNTGLLANNATVTTVPPPKPRQPKSWWDKYVSQVGCEAASSVKELEPLVGSAVATLVWASAGRYKVAAAFGAAYVAQLVIIREVCVKDSWGANYY